MKRLCEMNKNTLMDILETVIDNMDDWLIIGDVYGKIVYVNDVVLQDCEPTKENIIGQDMCMFLGVDLSDEITLAHIQNFINRGEKFDFITTRFIKDDSRIYLANQIFMAQAGGVSYCICLSKDITNTQKLKEEIYKANYFDNLTHLPNYKVFLESLNKHIYKAKKNKTPFAIILIDIRCMGKINNLYSISAGDYVISTVARRIKDVLENKQELFKYKEDVFAMIFENYEQFEEIEKILKKIDLKIDEPIEIQNNRKISIKVNAGIALDPQDSMEAHELLEMAQVALVHAKKNLHSHAWYDFYSNEIQEFEEKRLKAEMDLQEAVRRDEFVIYYQPFVGLKEDKLVGMEALIRRQKKSGELVMPGQFISMLEEMNLIEKVGMVVLEKVCIQIREWLDKNYRVVPISVNLSAIQFKNTHLARDIEQIVARYDIPPEYIVLEITESTVMEDVGVVLQSIHQLKADGFSISMDDFGTGYASIGYLKKVMFDHLKIDISFIREIVRNQDDRAIVKAIIAIAKTLKLTTIAEGIESEEQLDVMSALGCEIGQGFYWDRPISAETIEGKYLKVYL